MNEEERSPLLTDIPRYVPPAEEYALATTAEAESASRVRIPKLNLALFLLTLLTTTMAGAFMAGVKHPLLEPSGLLQGLSFSIPLMAILLVHELGHYITSLRNKVNATLPYFIPAPFPSVFIIGTFGAFIRMKSPPRSRRVMFDIGAAGPWAGAVLAVIAVVVGLHYSTVLPLSQSSGGLNLGNSLLFMGLAKWVLGVNPNAVTIDLNPIAFAGWIGLFVTTLNLLPVGQLDGGHVIYALFGRRHRYISRAFILACVLMVAVPALHNYFMASQWSFWLGWLVWAALLLLLGLGHPSTVDANTPLDRPRRIAAWATIALFIVTFSPVPISLSPPTPSVPQGRTLSVVFHPAAAPQVHGFHL